MDVFVGGSNFGSTVNDVIVRDIAAVCHRRYFWKRDAERKSGFRRTRVRRIDNSQGCFREFSWHSQKPNQHPDAARRNIPDNGATTGLV
jgi:hypothetical protein